MRTFSRHASITKLPSSHCPRSTNSNQQQQHNTSTFSNQQNQQQLQLQDEEAQPPPAQPQLLTPPRPRTSAAAQEQPTPMYAAPRLHCTPQHHYHAASALAHLPASSPPAARPSSPAARCPARGLPWTPPSPFPSGPAVADYTQFPTHLVLQVEASEHNLYLLCHAPVVF